MVPHAGADSDLFRAVTDLGATLKTLAPVAGSEREPAKVGIVYDWESWWASEQDSHPTSLLDYRQEALDWYSALLRLGVRADLVTTRADLSRHQVLIAPVLHMVPADLAKDLTRYAEQGGHLITTYFSAVVDENDHVWLGGYPGALRDLLGLRIEEFGPLLAGDTVELDDATTGSVWTDRITVTDAQTQVLARYRTGAQAGRPAVTRRDTDGGSAAYVSTRLGVEGLTALLPRLLGPAGVESELPEAIRGLVEPTVRRGPDGRFLFLVNRTDGTVPVTGLPGEVLVGATAADGTLTLGPRDVAVLRQPAG
jgi:beta-galactosidase